MHVFEDIFDQNNIYISILSKILHGLSLIHLVKVCIKGVPPEADPSKSKRGLFMPDFLSMEIVLSLFGTGS